jgi:H+/Cl- antiporter ClcA
LLLLLLPLLGVLLLLLLGLLLLLYVLRPLLRGQGRLQAGCCAHSPSARWQLAC